MSIVVIVTVSVGIGILRLHLTWRRCYHGGNGWCKLARAALNDFVKLSAVQPNTSALWAVINFNVQALGHEQVGGGTGRAFHIFPLNVIRGTLIVVALVLAFAFITALDVVLVGTAVALYAVIKFGNTLLDVLAANVVRCVFVAAITGKTAVVIAHMAGDASCVMVFVQNKVLVVVKVGRGPLVLRVALQTVSGDLFVQ